MNSPMAKLRRESYPFLLANNKTNRQATQILEKFQKNGCEMEICGLKLKQRSELIDK